jgi:hypothetical protein
MNFRPMLMFDLILSVAKAIKSISRRADRHLTRPHRTAYLVHGFSHFVTLIEFMKQKRQNLSAEDVHFCAFVCIHINR